MPVSDDWNGAASEMTVALEQWKALRGQPGGTQARANFHRALDHFEALSELL